MLLDKNVGPRTTGNCAITSETMADMDVDMEIDFEIDPEVAQMQAAAEALDAVRLPAPKGRLKVYTLTRNSQQ